jgi:hypothetical protein
MVFQNFRKLELYYSNNIPKIGIMEKSKVVILELSHIEKKI